MGEEAALCVSTVFFFKGNGKGPPNPDAPCMDYLPYMKGEQWPYSRANVGKYSLHGAFGKGRCLENIGSRTIFFRQLDCWVLGDSS